jgi:hypothetical protein
MNADNPLAALADRVWLAASEEGLPPDDAEFLFKAGFVAALQLPPDNPEVKAAVELARSIMAAPGVKVVRA